MRGYLNLLTRFRPVLLVLLVLDTITFAIALRCRLHITGPPMSLIALVLLLLNPFPEVYDPSCQTLDEELSAWVDELARRAGIASLPVVVLRSRKIKGFDARIADGKIMVSRAMRHSFSPSMIEFVLAHEVAHMLRQQEYRLAHPSNRFRLVAYLVIAATTVVCLRLVENPGFLWPALGLIVAAAAIILPLTKAPVGATPELELWCDRKAIELTGDPRAAIQALELMKHPNSSWGAKLSGYPPGEERVRQVQTMLPISSLPSPQALRSG